MSSLDLRIEDILETAVYELDTVISQEHADQIVELLRTKDKRKLDDREIRSRLALWYKERTLRNRRINFRKLDFDYTIECAAKLETVTLEEKRSIRRVDLPYCNQEIPTAPHEDLWAKAPLKDFREEEISWVRSGSHRVEDCHKCHRTGEVRCKRCNGSGDEEDRCMRCHGSGRIDKIGSTRGSETRTCTRCRGRGTTTSRCNRCRGTGDVTCPTCDGERILFTYEEIVAKTDLQSEQKLVSNLEHLNVKWLPPSSLIKLDHSSFPTPEITPETTSIEVGKQYQLRFFDVHQIKFWHKEEREILLLDKEVYPIDGSYLRDWRSIIYLGVGLISLVVVLYLLINYLNS